MTTPRGAEGPAPASGSTHTPDEIARRPLRLAFFSPVPPAASGIADYAADLLPLLPEAWELEVFTPAGSEVERVGDRAPARPYGAWEEVSARHPFDLTVHQVGNDAALADHLERARRHPGLLVLHDVVLHPARAGAAIAAGRLERYREAVRHARPDVAGPLGHLVAGGLAGPSLFWRFPLCEDLVRASRLTVVHGEILAAWLRALVPDAPVGSVVHWRSVERVPAADVQAWRSRLGASEGIPLLATFGHVGAAHRLDVVLGALARLPEDSAFRFAVVGRVDAGLDLPGRAERLGLADRVHWLGRVDAVDFGALMAAADLAFNLRYPTARASSGTLQQLLQLGTPVVVTDLLHLREIPDEFVIRVPPGSVDEEAETLSTRLLSWLRRPQRHARASRVARAWASREITPEAMARSYVAAVARALAAPER